MGSGKTTIGLHLAKKLDVPFVDSDKVIEEQAGYAISEIFERDGEQFFRKVEAKTIAEILGRNEICVLATGGGAFMNEETRKILKEKSISIWLNASLNILIDRLEHNNTRPLLTNVDKKQMLQKLMDERYPIYAQADIIVDTDVNSRTIVGNEIMEKLEKLCSQ